MTEHEMTGEELGLEILESIRQWKAGKIERVTLVDTEGTGGTLASEARRRLGLSQSAFAAMLGISVRTLQEWEQGRRNPSGAAEMLLKVAILHPEAVMGANVPFKTISRTSAAQGGITPESRLDTALSTA